MEIEPSIRVGLLMETGLTGVPLVIEPADGGCTIIGDAFSPLIGSFGDALLLMRGGGGGMVVRGICGRDDDDCP